MKCIILFIVLFALYWSGSTEKPSYYPQGPQNGVPISDLVGWSLCWSKSYLDSDVNLYAGAYECATATHILMGCGPTNISTHLQLLAVGNASLVTSRNFGTLSGTDVVPYFVEDNNSTWYFSDAKGWGFFPTGAMDAYPNDCDLTNDWPQQRLCWHTSEYTQGYRCGDYNEDTYVDTYYTKYIYVPTCSFDGMDCDDGNACTTNDTCTAGTCAGTPITCIPSNPCYSAHCYEGHCMESVPEGPCGPVQTPVQAPAAAPQGKTSSAMAMNSIYAASLMLVCVIVVALM